MGFECGVLYFQLEFARDVRWRNQFLSQPIIFILKIKFTFRRGDDFNDRERLVAQDTNRDFGARDELLEDHFIISCKRIPQFFFIS